MSSITVFDEPDEPSEGPFASLADWCRRSGAPDAHAARHDINALYAAFPGNPMVLSRLRGEDGVNTQQAIDELYVHHLLSQSCDPRYEDGDEDDQKRMDFGLYKSSDYVAGVEVRTLFSDKDFEAERLRNAALSDEINKRVKATDWYVSIEVNRWTRQPRVKAVTTWLTQTMDDLPTPTGNLTRTDYPTRTYRSRAVELEFTFLPRTRTTPPTDSESIVKVGPQIWRFGGPVKRVRGALTGKGGSRYAHRDRPFAIVLSVRDFMCDTEDIIDALYGDETVTVSRGEPGSARSIRIRNGLFTISRAQPEGRNRRISCVFVLMRGWMPGSNVIPTVLRLDNPFAEHSFPVDLLVPDRHFVSRRDDSGIHMEWVASEAPSHLR